MNEKIQEQDLLPVHKNTNSCNVVNLVTSALSALFFLKNVSKRQGDNIGFDDLCLVWGNR